MATMRASGETWLFDLRNLRFRMLPTSVAPRMVESGDHRYKAKIVDVFWMDFRLVSFFKLDREKGRFSQPALS